MAGHGEGTVTVGFVRRRRSQPPPVPATEIAIAAPPQLPGRERGAVLRLVPVAMAVAMVALMAVGYRSGYSAGHGRASLAFPALMLGSVVATAVSGRARRHDVDADRADYLDYLVDLRSSVTGTAAAQRLSLTWCHPAPQALWQLVGGPRLWERQPDDADFGAVRVGVGSAPLATGLVAPAIGAMKRTDPVTATALRRFVETYSTVPEVPITIGLFDRAAICLDGDRDGAGGLLRAMICQLAVLHGPDRVLVAAVVGSRGRERWEWLKWLPHHQHPIATDAAGPARMVYPTLAAAEAALAGLAVDQHLVVIVDGGVVEGTESIITDSRTADTTVVELGTGCAALTGAAIIRLRVTPTALLACGPDNQDGEEVLARPDRLELIEALVCARRLAGYRIAGAAAGAPEWADLIGIADVIRFDPAVGWNNLKPSDRLRVPIGTAAGGQRVYLDIKEAAENGMGPHGLCIGATGSGKSEFLRTIVLGMMAQHSPAVLNLVLVDFKGGATFLDLRRSPHVAAVITNLADDAPLVDRMRAALAGELNRRQEILRGAGNLVSVAAYDDARRAGAALPPLPALVVIVDEFSELLSQQPDFADMFVAIGRLGRSLGVHLLLASQRLDEGRLRGLESHLSYRVCLKTLSANESRAVLGVPDAHQLPNTPGMGYLCSAAGELVRFQTALVSGPVLDTATPSHGGDAPGAVRLFCAGPNRPATSVGSSSGGRTVLQTVLDRLSGQGPPARQVWLPPLAEPPSLGSLLTGVGRHDDLVVPVGIVDRPFEQRRTPLLVDLRGAAGNVAVVGAPQSGKSTALAALITALAATCDPLQVQLYCLDFGGGTLASLQALPQVGSVAGRGDPELVRRTVSEMESIVRRREALFADRGIASVNRYRQLRAERNPTCGDDPFGDVFLVIDGWAGLCGEFDALEPPIVGLAGRGLSYGVHVVVSASRWAEIRPALRDQIGTRVELRLGDPADSELDRRQAAQVPRDKPGRALVDDGLHALIALPGLDDLEPVRAGGSAAPPVPRLPAIVHRSNLIEAAKPGRYPLFGIEEAGLDAVAIDFSRQPHLLIYGDNECGKTSALRVICRELVRTHTAAQARLLVVDYRRSLLGVVDPEHLSGYAISAATLNALLPDLLNRVAARMPGPEVTGQQLRDSSWWSGPDLYLLVDDYDLVATAAGNPLTPLLEYLPHAGDLGLHLVVARRSGGAARAVYEPLLAALRDLGCMGLVMSGDPDEGPLIGSVRPVSLPPGRGTLVTRAGGAQLMQVAWSPPP